MLIRLGYEIGFECTSPTPIVALLNVHASRVADLQQPDQLRIEPAVPVEGYTDSFGNYCSRFVLPAGASRLLNHTVIADSGLGDPVAPEAGEVPLHQLPAEVLQYLLPSRYCEVDLLGGPACDLFAAAPHGWGRVQAICDWVHTNVLFGYAFARPTKTALDVFTERKGVCRDFQHLAVTFCRAMNIPARYVTGYLGDIGVPPAAAAMDFSAWFEAYLDGRWWTFDARHNRSRQGRVLMAVGRDAADVALTTAFGVANLKQFTVISEEVQSSVADAAG